MWRLKNIAMIYLGSFFASLGIFGTIKSFSMLNILIITIINGTFFTALGFVGEKLLTFKGECLK